MKDYKRLTNPASGLPNLWTAYNRLLELEDKIEIGEIGNIRELKSENECLKREIARLAAENERLKEEKTCRNLSENNPVDEFICSECGFMTEDFSRLVIDEDDGERFNYEYEIKFCPNCGAKVEEEQ